LETRPQTQPVRRSDSVKEFSLADDPRGGMMPPLRAASF
jgi:hypothetical protein